MVRATSSNVLRRITTLLIISCLLTVVLSPNTAAALPGSGTQEDPWRIESLADFDEFAADPNYWDDYTRLETDVNLAGRTYYTAIIAPDVDNSNYDFDGTPFTGVFDGNDHKIVNLTINGGAGNRYLGLFGCMGEDGEVRNLGLEGGSVSGNIYVGGLVGYIEDGRISNCYSTSDVNGYIEVGGLVGGNDGSISNCYFGGSVSGTGSYSDSVGGLVGGNDGSISNCYFSGSVSGTGSYSDSVGGLVGWNNGNGSVSNCYSTGNVNGVYSVGGLIGENSGSISNCYSTGNVNGTANYVGGLMGSNVGNISNCYSTGDVSGYGEVGGLVGDNSDGTIIKCYAIGNVNGVYGVAGLVGLNLGSVSNCYSTGDVNGYGGVGGLVGDNGSPAIPPGGPYPGYIYNSYSTGNIEGTSSVGGLVGCNLCGDIERSFWDVQTSGEPNMCGYQNEVYATGCDPNCGKTSAQMQTRSTFTEAGWDFVEIWLINNGATYPVLRQEIRSDLNGDDSVNMLDFAVFADHWLEGTGD